MKRTMVFVPVLFMSLGLSATTHLDHPIVISTLANLVLENPWNANLLCLIHWLVKHNNRYNQQSAIEDFIGYLLGSAIGRCIRPEVKVLWQSMTSSAHNKPTQSHHR